MFRSSETVEKVGGSRVAALQSGLPTDGANVLDAVITELGHRVSLGEPCAIIWDIDGTIVDTRRRMLAALHAYGRTDVTVEQLHDTAPHTDDMVRDFGLDPLRFKLVWDRVFWDGRAFGLDRPIPEVVERMRRAAKLGIRNIVMTGRNHELAADSQSFLHRHGVPFHMLLTKSFAQNTVKTKVARLGALLQAGLRIGAFVTDAAREIAGIQEKRELRGIACVAVAARGRPIRHAAGITAHAMPVDVRR